VVVVIWYVGGVCADVIGWDVVGMLVDLPIWLAML
jgi:hypothetical protein